MGFLAKAGRHSNYQISKDSHHHMLLTSFAVGKNSLRIRQKTCADAILHAVSFGRVRVEATTRLTYALYAVNLMMAALVVRERDIEMMRELTR